MPSIRPADRAVSPVIGVALMLVIVVATAAVVGGLLLGIELPNDPAPQYRYQTDYVADGAGNTNDRPYVNITLTGGRIEPGEDFYVVDSDGNAVRWDAVWTTAGPLTAGDYAHIDGYGSDSALNHACEDEVYRLVHRPGDGESATLLSVEISTPAVGNATSHC
ncbi:type IV pilin [Halobellus clavatus]|jgi:flagellin-like protein|uniref:Flagellin N-terminal-like domain-containing protein n=1 Tax=Halobellus clavatus TaxID=660517 RepID=A0A1H3D7V8_9EURY|nr:type IV pilin N-terminal domain-containing protein [Halobellus clavatus]SDX62416.1 flagellin N-terminal-like domain-containing protein [Halobellus clavatus]